MILFITQLNQEVSSLDWTKSRSHTLSGRSISGHYEEILQYEVTSSNSGTKLGGASNSMATARASSVAAAYSRLLNASSEEPCTPTEGQLCDATVEPDPDDDELKGVTEMITAEPDPDDTLMVENYVAPPLESSIDYEEPDPDDSLHKDTQMMFEPDPDDPEIQIKCEPSSLHVVEASKIIEPDPDYSQRKTTEKLMEPDPDDKSEVSSSSIDSAQNGIVKAELDPNDDMDGLQRIEEPAAAICSRIQRAIEMLRSEATPVEASAALQTLVKIIRFASCRCSLLLPFHRTLLCLASTFISEQSRHFCLLQEYNRTSGRDEVQKTTEGTVHIFAMLVS